MSVRTGCFLSISAVLGWSALCAQASRAAEKPSELSARQLFFVAKPVAKTSSVPAVKTTAPRKNPPKAASEQPTVPAAPAAEAKAAPATPRLGLRYSILQPRDGKLEDVDIDKEFRSREYFGVSLRSNEDAFLYVVVQGSAGNWDVLFPYPGERNRVMAGQDVLIPPQCAPSRQAECFAFDDDPGTERMFVVLSATPETDLDRLINSVRSRGAGATAPPRQAGTATLASASLPGSEVDRLRQQMQLASRGIIRETVRRAPNSSQGENAMYIVASSSAPQSRVIVDIVLKHR